MMYEIKIDEEIWNFLKKHAEPLEDTPNSVLRRLLLGDESKIISASSSFEVDSQTPSFPKGTPTALQQILEVIFLVVKRGRTRKEATNIVAERRRIAPQTVIDKYTRQLNKKAFEIDQLLERNLPEFKSILERKFPNHREIINEFFKNKL